jgi:CDGSH-type Zn-finger protein/uncharacterized Fe-S cluster protein YjdI
MADKDITTYPGKTIDVTWDERLCIHIGECGKSEGDLFIGGRDPWCQPDLTSVDNTIDVVERCPSGALAYSCKDGNKTEIATAKNTVHLVYNGPLYLRGELNIDDATDDMPGTEFRAALCRCGHSKNKPFCDNNHLEANFEDSGAIGDSGETLQQTGGCLSVNAADDGPLLLSGNFSMVTSSGRVAWQGTKAALCRCGASKNKPFCDGSHKAAGFKSD